MALKEQFINYLNSTKTVITKQQITTETAPKIGQP